MVRRVRDTVLQTKPVRYAGPVSSPAVRRAVRSLALTPAVALLLGAGPAVAEAPRAWPKDPHVDPLHAILVLVVIPLGLYVVIWMLASMPSMMKGDSYQPGLAWRNEPEWFGGPSGGIERLDTDEGAAEAESRDTDTGGAGARR